MSASEWPKGATMCPVVCSREGRAGWLHKKRCCARWMCSAGCCCSGRYPAMWRMQVYTERHTDRRTAVCFVVTSNITASDTRFHSASAVCMCLLLPPLCGGLPTSQCVGECIALADQRHQQLYRPGAASTGHCKRQALTPTPQSKQEGGVVCAICVLRAHISARCAFLGSARRQTRCC